MCLSEFAEKCLALCMKWSASETSGYRTEKRNAAVGGHEDSTHLLGLGKDLVPDDLDDLPEMYKDAKRLGLWALNEVDHLHVQGIKPGGG